MPQRSWFLECLVVSALSAASTLSADDPLPKSLDPRVKIELFAEQPQIVTPTGIDIDSQGRVWAIESNTHFPPEDYQGHKTDRLLVLRDTNGDGRADDVQVFADGLTHAMSVAVRPGWFPIAPKKSDQGEIPSPKLSVYVATRREILLLHDDDGDMKSDRQERLVHLETTGNYPHNGLAGFAFDAMGWMHFGFGENLGADYAVIGSDGTKLTGGGEGGSLYRTRLDGSQLTRWATGFWNPHASCIDAYGRMFSVDNDPDSRPPCRLLHIIPGGDYGYRFRNGRKGLHPFTSWNGEIPGTLPMVAGTGEAPSGIIAYESDGLPADYIGDLLVGSWGDHRIDRFRLKMKGSSFTSLAEPLITGTENFRPVGLDVAPDGSIYCTDWVSREYKLHGKGRIWRISSVQPREKPVVQLTDLQQLGEIGLYEQLHSASLPVRRTAAHQLIQTAPGRSLLVTEFADSAQPSRTRLEAFWAVANLALRPDAPTDLLVGVRSLSAAHSGSTGSAAFSRNREENYGDEVLCASAWLRTTTPSNNILYQQVLRLGTRSANYARQQLGVASSVNLATALGIQPETLKDVANPMGYFSSDGFSDPFLLSVNVRTLSYVSGPEVFREWWTSQLPPDPNDAEQRMTREMFDRLRNAPPELRANMTAELRGRRTVTRRVVRSDSRVALTLLARQRFPQNTELAALTLQDPEPLVKRLAVQWIAEEKLKGLRPQVEAVLQESGLTSDLFLATLAALEMLDGVNPVDFDKTPASKYVMPLVQKEGPATVRALALQMVSPSDPALTTDLFKSLLASPDERLRLEAIRTLQLSPLPGAAELLVGIAGDAGQPDVARAEAIAGLVSATKIDSPENTARKTLHKILLGDNTVLKIEALRTLRGLDASSSSALVLKRLSDSLPQVPQPQDDRGRGFGRPGAIETSNPQAELQEQIRLTLLDPKAPIDPNVRIRSNAEWSQIAGLTSLEGRGGQVFPGNGLPRAATSSADAAAGRRVFFHANSAGCYKCHTIDGRGGKVGPDLTTIARTMDRTKLVQSILEPSREQAPQFTSWNFELTSGQVLTGLLISEESEKLKVATADGKVHDLTLKDIETRVPQSVSLMPEKLVDRLTPQEFIDLLAFLETLK